MVAVLQDLRAVGCDIITVGQYLQPSPHHLPVQRFVPPEEFISYKEEALRLGFTHVESGPFVRSSYHAHQLWDTKVSGNTSSGNVPDLQSGGNR